MSSSSTPDAPRHYPLPSSPSPNSLDTPNRNSLGGSKSAIWSDYPKHEYVQDQGLYDPAYDAIIPTVEKDSSSDMIVREKKHHATEVIATTRARRWWLRITWALTWWVPSYFLRKFGKMSRPDMRMAWREKLAIFMMVFMLCGTVIFYIVIFGRLLCPNSAKAWNETE
jgi:chitin synthase